MTSDATLLSDQVFQLNTFLWALEDLPEGGATEPVLRNADYYLSSDALSYAFPVHGVDNEGAGYGRVDLDWPPADLVELWAAVAGSGWPV